MYDGSGSEGLFAFFCRGGGVGEIKWFQEGGEVRQWVSTRYLPFLDQGSDRKRFEWQFFKFSQRWYRASTIADAQELSYFIAYSGNLGAFKLDLGVTASNPVLVFFCHSSSHVQGLFFPLGLIIGSDGLGCKLQKTWLKLSYTIKFSLFHITRSLQALPCHQALRLLVVTAVGIMSAQNHVQREEGEYFPCLYQEGTSFSSVSSARIELFAHAVVAKVAGKTGLCFSISVLESRLCQ